NAIAAGGIRYLEHPVLPRRTVVNGQRAAIDDDDIIVYFAITAGDVMAIEIEHDIFFDSPVLCGEDVNIRLQLDIAARIEGIGKFFRAFYQPGIIFCASPAAQQHWTVGGKTFTSW